MVRSGGYRSATRDLFSVAFKRKGHKPLKTFLRAYKLGDYVDIKVNGGQQKGMPHKWYQGKTGRVWNVAKRSVGIEVNKVVRQRVIKKRINARIEHVHPSRCREDFLKRRAINEQKKEQANKEGVRIGSQLKRQPQGPRSGFMLEDVEMETVAPIPYDVLKEGLLS